MKRGDERDYRSDASGITWKNDGRADAPKFMTSPSREGKQSDRNDNGVSSGAEAARQRRSSEMALDGVAGKGEKFDSPVAEPAGRLGLEIPSNQLGRNLRGIIPDVSMKFLAPLRRVSLRIAGPTDRAPE